MAALEVISATATNPGAAPALGNAAAVPGDTFQIKNAPMNAYLLDCWARLQVAAGFFSYRSPRLHDNVQGIRINVALGAAVKGRLPQDYAQPLISQDTLSVTIGVADAAADVENATHLIYYPSLPGSDGRFIGLGELKRRFVHFFTQPITVTPTAGATYSGSIAINSLFDLMKANTDYALLGMTTTTANEATIGLRGPDTGNLRVGVPADPFDVEDGKDFFIELTKQYGVDLIPVINSANKGATAVDVLSSENFAAQTVNLIMAQLAPAGTGA